LQLQRGLDNIAVNKAGEEVSTLTITSRQALEWVTTEGAKALQLDHKIGQLVPGKQADITMVRTDDLNLFASAKPEETLLYQSNSGNVDTVIVAGRVLKRHGKLAYPDLDRRKAELAESGRRLLHNVGTEK
jgi:cytosine/adenosine deaminase-related metal-dependent hydrolase